MQIQGAEFPTEGCYDTSWYLPPASALSFFLFEIFTPSPSAMGGSHSQSHRRDHKKPVVVNTGMSRHLSEVTPTGNAGASVRDAVTSSSAVLTAAGSRNGTASRGSLTPLSGHVVTERPRSGVWASLRKTKKKVETQLKW